MHRSIQVPFTPLKSARALATLLALGLIVGTAAAQDMDALWGEDVVKLRADGAARGQLFDEGNYAMFIHWGLYAQLANKVDGKTYYAIGEWIMHPRVANIPVPEYMALAKTFNPVKFDAMEIAQLAKDAGMKYIIITSKHHDGFAMYHSKANAFNVVDATPFKRDPMKDLAEACRKLGLGFGFYYSHNQDWTFPGGKGGPAQDAAGNPATFDDYFRKKCLPQVKEITSQYGPITLVWFDTPGRMPKHYVQELVDVVRTNQPNALVSGRAGHGLGDYQTLGDMEVPSKNVEGMWESVDTTNDSWAYAWYDENWKSPKEILRRLIACVARGGTYMLNIGPRGDGSVPERAAWSLRRSGEWIRRYPQVVYATDASPWEHALPWGDVTVKGNRMFLSIFEWPESGDLYLPGLKTAVKSAKLLKGKDSEPLPFNMEHGWVHLQLPGRAPEPLVSIVEVELAGKPEADPCWALDPGADTVISAKFATATNAKQGRKRWMEKFGEWKHVTQVTNWMPGSAASWEVDVLKPGEYLVSLSYTGEGRLVWGVRVEGGMAIQNQQNASQVYQEYPIGWLKFDKPGRYTVSATCLDGETKTASLSGIRFTKVK